MLAHEYSVLDTPDAVTKTFGGPGRGILAFNNVKGSAVVQIPSKVQYTQPEYIVAVSDAGNNRVQVFTDSGEHLRNLGNPNGDPDDEPGGFDMPGGLCFGGAETLDPQLAVADQNNHRVQLFRSFGERMLPDAILGREGDVKEQSGVGGRAGMDPSRPDYGGCLTTTAGNLRLNRPGGCCWVEEDEKRNMLVVSDSGNHRLQLVDLDSGAVRVLCGKELLSGPTAIAFHNGWRWCRGGQCVPPPAPATWPLPPWFAVFGSKFAGSDGARELEAETAAKSMAKELFDLYTVEKERAEEVRAKPFGDRIEKIVEARAHDHF